MIYEEKQIESYKNQQEDSLSFLQLKNINLKQKRKIEQLKMQLSVAQKVISRQRKSNQKLSQAAINAAQQAEEVEKQSLLRYQIEVEELNIFHTKWLNHYKKLFAKYPVGYDFDKLEQYNVAMNSILNIDQSEFSADDEENFFDYKEALNPTDDLMSILKEIGLGCDNES
ncbi:MAG: hypothetical protein LBU60_05075 [Clostridiales bacterium]|jgi:hypothetical protein|nr:hypothetical protein [Clostridiales bacterium]